jgi:hypothetical protein
MICLVQPFDDLFALYKSELICNFYNSTPPKKQEEEERGGEKEGKERAKEKWTQRLI